MRRKELDGEGMPKTSFVVVALARAVVEVERVASPVVVEQNRLPLWSFPYF